jgi:K+-transporting ATPase A subunit
MSMDVNGGCWIYLAVICVIFAVNFFIGGLLIQYTAEYWGARIKEAPIDLNYWHCCLVGIPLAQVALPSAAITWVISWFD